MDALLNQALTLPCGAILQNRIAKAALTERIAGANRLPNEKHHTLYHTWAKYGAGLLLSGNIMVDKRYLESTGNLVIEKGTDLVPFQKWTKKVLAQGHHFWAQISHAGRQSTILATRKSVSASDVQLKKMGLFGKPVPLTEAGIEEVIQRFIHAIAFCQKAGFTGVQLHGAHGYLISQFLSPRTNKRDDQWGGSIENRARLLFEIVGQARKVVGPDFPISVKLNSADFQRGGFDEEDAKYVIKSLEKRGVDLLEISGGTYETTAMFGMGLKDSTRQREAYFLEFAKEIRQDCQMPLMVTGGFRTRSFAEEALKNNELDVVGFGRPFIVDPAFPKGFLEGSQEKVEIPDYKVADPKNKDIAEAGFYDLLLKQLSKGKPLNFKHSGLKIASHIPLLELRMGMRNWLFG